MIRALHRKVAVWGWCVLVAAIGGRSADAQRTVASDRQSVSDRTAAALLERRVTIHVNRVSRSAALDSLAATARELIQYQANTVDGDGVLISLHLIDVSVQTALDSILVGTSLRVIPDGTTQLSVVSARTARALQSTVTVIGRVIDSVSGTKLSGAKVSVKGTSIMTLTGEDGRYVLPDVPTGAHTLVARLLGYTAAEVDVTLRVGGDTTVLFTLHRMNTMLSEVVTTATGERQRVEVGNSSARLDVDSLRKIAPITSVTDLLDGHVPGVVVTRGSGAPGSPSRVRVRGIGSVSASNDPIIIVNGVRVYSNQTTSERDAQFSVLDRMDPSTIQTIEVLRGPSASALYGSDASAGVIVITTRQGESGRTYWAFSTDQQRTTQPQNFPTLYYREGIGDIGNALQGCPLGRPGCRSPRVTVYNPLSNPRTSVLGTGYRQSYSATVSGGSPTIRFALTGNTDATLGLLKMSDADVDYVKALTGLDVPRWQRRPQSESNTGGSARFTFQPVAALSLDLTTTLNRSLRTTTPLSNALAIYQSFIVPDDTLLVNNKISDFRRRNTYKDLSLLNSITAKWTPTTSLMLSGDAGLQEVSQQSLSLLRRGDCMAGACDAVSVLGGLSSDQGKRSVGTINLNTTLRMPPRLGVQLTPVIGVNYIRQSISDVTVAASNLLLGSSSSNGAQNVQIVDNGNTPVQMGFFVTTGVWLFNERLHTEVGTRVDASNSLGKQVRPNYPKLDLSYPISRESFFPPSLGSLRLRLAYGHSAKQPEVGATLRSYRNGFGVENGQVVPVQYLATLGNTQLRPERTTEIEGGFDWGVFGERMHLSVTPWQKLSRDALVDVLPPGSVAGDPGQNAGTVTTFTSNIGSVRNVGIELSLDARLVNQRLIRWDIASTLSRERNTLVKLAPEASRNLINGLSTGDAVYGTRYVEGYPLAGTWLRPTNGYADVNGDGAIDPSEITYADSSVYVGGPLPNYKASFDTRVELWNSRITVATHFDYENGMSQVNTAVLQNIGLVNTTIRALNDPSTSLSEQAAYRSGYAAMHTLSTLRLQSLSIRLTAPDRIVRRLRASAASIALQGSNLGLWTNYSGADPNVTGSIVGNTVSDPGVLPMPQSWGLNVSLNY